MPQPQLSQIDLHRMLASGAKLAAENSRVEAEKMRALVNQQGAEISYLKAQITMAEAARQSADRRKAADDMLAAARRDHEQLSKELAERYDVDFATASFCPLSGEIVSDEDAEAAGNATH